MPRDIIDHPLKPGYCLLRQFQPTPIITPSNDFHPERDSANQTLHFTQWNAYSTTCHSFCHIVLSEEIRWRVPSPAFNVLHNYSCHNTNLCAQCVSLQTHPLPFFVKYEEGNKPSVINTATMRVIGKGASLQVGGAGRCSGEGGSLLINYFGVQ